MVRERSAVERPRRPERPQSLPIRMWSTSRSATDRSPSTSGRRRLKSPPNTSGRSPAQPRAAARGDRDVAPRALWRVRGGVEVDDPHPAGELDAVRPASLRDAAEPHRRWATIRSARARIALAPPPLDLIRSGHRTATPGARQQRIARGEDRCLLTVAAAGQRLGPPRRYLLQQRDVPFPAGERAGEVAPACRVLTRAPNGRA